MALGDMVVIDEELCTACGVCVNICPNDVLELAER
jgi:NAD-dependent dihydropyrimidine dehydrogenase PreA subunit